MNLSVRRGNVLNTAENMTVEPENDVGRKPIKVLQFICPTGFYGAEGWILALASNSDPSSVQHHLAVTHEWDSHDLELTRRYRKLELPVHELDMSGRFDLRIIPRLVRLVREQRIDIIHTHGYKSDLLGLVVAKLSGIVSVATPHGFENTSDWKLRFYIRLGCAAFRYFDKVVPLSGELLADVRQMHVKDSRLAYIANGVDLEPVVAHRHSREKLRLSNPDTDQVIGYIGQLISRKNVADIISAFEKLNKKLPRTRLVIVGDGDCRSFLEKMAAELDCHDRIEFRGFVSNPLVHLKEFDLFVMCSSLEGIPRCLMEAMAMGVPVVAYDIPGVDQLIEDEITGLLAPLRDSTTLMQQCERALTDATLAQSISTKAFARVSEKFSAKRMADSYLTLFRELLAQHSETECKRGKGT